MTELEFRRQRAHPDTAPPARRLQAAATGQTSPLPRERGVPIHPRAVFWGSVKMRPSATARQKISK